MLISAAAGVSYVYFSGDGLAWTSWGNNMIDYYTYKGANLEYSINLSNNLNPANNTQFNTPNINFSVIGNISRVTNVSFYINGVFNQTYNVTGPKTSYNFTFNTTFEDGLYNYTIALYDNNTITNRSAWFYIDTNSPTMVTNMTNRSIYKHNTYYYTFNFSDNIILSSVNISINKSTYYYNNSMGTIDFNLTLPFRFSNYSYGSMVNISVTYADGHTAAQINDYKIEKPWFSEDELTFKFEENQGYNTGSITITSPDSGDVLTAEKLNDRYIFQYTPSEKAENYTFNVESSFDIQIINAPWTEYKKWIIFDNHWMDWSNEKTKDISIEYEKGNKKKVMVTISNVKDEKIEPIIFKSIGDLNIVTQYFNQSINISSSEAVYLGASNGTETQYKQFDIDIIKIPGFTISSLFILNGTEYTASITDYTDYYNYHVGLYLPLINTDLANLTYIFNYSHKSATENITNGYYGEFYTKKIIAYPCNNSEYGNYPFLNISYYDENTLSKVSVNSTIYITGMTQNTSSPHSRDYTLNYTGWYNHSICMYPNDTFTMNYSVVYKGAGYPQRTYSAIEQSLDNVTELLSLYLLSLSDGLYARFRTIDTYSSIIQGVTIKAYESITGVLTEQGTTDGAGIVTFWLNPDKYYDMIFTKTGYTSANVSVRPTSSDIYTMTLSTTSYDNRSVMTGIKYTFSPIGQTLNNNTVYNFTFNLSSTYWNIDAIYFYIRNTSEIIASISNTTSQGNLTINLNVLNNSKLTGVAVYTIAGVNYTREQDWKVRHVFVGTGSINNFLTDLENLTDIDNFSKALLAFLFISLVMLSLNVKYPIIRESSIIPNLVILNLLILFFSYVGFFQLDNTSGGIDSYAIFLVVLVSSAIVAINNYRYGSG